ncbi:hypothetical protein ACFL03_06520 [Thermodesulfobacteriota bacterium]
MKTSVPNILHFSVKKNTMTAEDHQLFDAVMKRLEAIVLGLVNISAKRDTPLEIRIHPETKKRLKDLLVYHTLDYALQLHNKCTDELMQSRPHDNPEDISMDVYPILGNTIQIVFEYINGFISRDEFVEFDELLRSEAEGFINKRKTPWKDSPIEAFYTPSSYSSRQKNPIASMGVFLDWSEVKEKYSFFMKMKAKYRKDE